MRDEARNVKAPKADRARQIPRAWICALAGGGVLSAILTACSPLDHQPDPPPSVQSTASTVRLALVDGPVAKIDAFDCLHIVRHGQQSGPLDHGTAMTSILTDPLSNSRGSTERCSSFPPGLEIHSFDATTDGRPDASAAARAIEAAVDLELDVVNINLAFASDAPDLQSATTSALNKGLIVIAPAGNTWGLNATFPAIYPGVLSVGSHDAHGRPSAFSAREGVTLRAPGEEVKALNPDASWGSVSGTSVAAATVTREIIRELVRGATRSKAVSVVTTNHPIERNK